jgi:hypothetical protein
VCKHGMATGTCTWCNAPAAGKRAQPRTLGTAPLGYYHRGGPRNVAARAPGALALSVRRSPRWAGSGPAHWHHGTVRTRTQRPVQAQANTSNIRKRGMYGY